jgi:hypothetical protein
MFEIRDWTVFSKLLRLRTLAHNFSIFVFTMMFLIFVSILLYRYAATIQSIPRGFPYRS